MILEYLLSAAATSTAWMLRLQPCSTTPGLFHVEDLTSVPAWQTLEGSASPTPLNNDLLEINKRIIKILMIFPY